MKSKLTSLIVFILCRICFPLLHGLLAVLPAFLFVPLCRFLGCSVAFLVSLAPSSDRRRCLQNLERADINPGVEPILFYRRMLAERFSHYLETLYEFANPGSCVAINSKEFDQFMADNTDPEKGALAVTAHLGNWELMGKFMTVAVPSRTCLMLAKENKYAEVSRLTERIRLGMDMQVLFVSEKSGIKSIMKNLHKDTLIGLVADQKSAGRAGPRAQFFGLETDFVSGPQRLAMKFSLPLLLCYAIRTGPLRYQILFTRLESTSSDSLESFTQSMAAEFESSIRKHPTQWTWDYKKWLL